jgi:hypothetical protein
MQRMIGLRLFKQKIRSSESYVQKVTSSAQSRQRSQEILFTKAKGENIF